MYVNVLNCIQILMNKTYMYSIDNLLVHAPDIVPVSLVGFSVPETPLVNVESKRLILFTIHQVALRRTKATGQVENTTYYPGCYLLRPGTEFIYFNNTGYWFTEPEFSVFTDTRLAVDIGVSIVYYLRYDFFLIFHPKKIFFWQFSEHSSIKYTIVYHKHFVILPCHISMTKCHYFVVT